MSPSVSVIVPVYDGARWLAEALASALAQTTPPDEIVVVDDGSSDESAAIARATPGVRCVSQPHQGVAAARNRGLDEARGELIAFLDADDTFAPDKLATQVASMIERPELGFTLTHQRYVLEPDVPVPAWIVDGDVARETLCYGTGSMVAWARVFTRVGRFDTGRTTGEDSDWMARAADAGVVHGIIARPLLVRRVHAHNLSSSDRRQYRADVFAVLRASIARKRGAP